MQRRLLRAVLATVLTVEAAAAAGAEERHTARCVAARTFEVRMTSAGRTAELEVESRQRDARITGVLLRSPYKSEGVALPTVERAGDSPGTYLATFDVDAIRELPKGDVNVVLVTPDGERICRVKNRDRQKLLAVR